MFKKSLSEGQAGDNVGLLLRRIQRDDVVRGQVVCKPGSVTPHQKFKGEIYALTKEEGGRHTPFFSNYKPQFFFRTADITGNACLGSTVCSVCSRLLSDPCCNPSCVPPLAPPNPLLLLRRSLPMFVHSAARGGHTAVAAAPLQLRSFIDSLYSA